jgi:hypothetical protein
MNDEPDPDSCEIFDCPQNENGICFHTETKPEKCYHRKFTIRKEKGKK